MAYYYQEPSHTFSEYLLIPGYTGEGCIPSNVSLKTPLTNYRKGEREAWERLAAETKEDGTPRVPNAPGNARFWADTENEIEAIRKIIDDAPLLDEEATL